MRATPPHNSVPPANRLTALCLLATFVALLALPGIYQLLCGFRNGELARWRGWIREEPIVADAFRRVEDDLNARFLLATAVRNWRGDVVPDRLASPLFRDKLVDRDTEYLFVDADAAVPRAAGFMNRRLDRPTQAIATLADLHAKLSERGIHLLVVPIPSKASIYPDKLERGYDVARGPDLNAEHAAWFEALRARGVDAIDLTDALWVERKRELTDPDAATFTNGDSHWTWHGLSIAADAIAQRAAPFVETAPRRIGLHQNFVRRVREVDLVKSLDRPAPSESEPRAFLLDADGRVVTGDDPTSPIVLLGDSFAAGHDGEGSSLAQGIEFATGVRTRSQAVYGGSVATMRRPLARREVVNANVRVVVFAFAIRHLITSDWPMVPVATVDR